MPDWAPKLLGLTLFVVLVILWALRRARTLVAVREGLRRAGASDAHLAGTHTVRGTIGGRALEYVIDPGGEDTSPTTTVTLTAPPGLAPFEMHLSSQSRTDVRLVAGGREIDVIVGDPAFDDRVVVEAAPAEVARLALDEPMRAAILRRMPCRIDVDVAQARFQTSHEITRTEHATQVALFLAGLADRLAWAASGGVARHDFGAGDELAHLRAVRGARLRWKNLAVAIFGLVVVLSFAASAWRARHSHARSAHARPTHPIVTARPVASHAAPSVPFSEATATIEEVTPERWVDASDAPQPSPDGTKLLFMRTDDDVSTVVLHSLSDRRETVVAKDAASPRWAGARELAYVAHTSHGGTDQTPPPSLEVVAAEAPFAHVRTIAGDSLVAVSPDGRSYAHETPHGIVVDALDGVDAGAMHLELSGASELAVFAPDGRSIAYAGASGNVVTLDLATRRETKVVGTTGNFAWSPDGRWIAYCEGEVTMMRVDRSAAVRVKGAPCGPLAWASDGWVYVAETQHARILRLRLDASALR